MMLRTSGGAISYAAGTRFRLACAVRSAEALDGAEAARPPARRHALPPTIIFGRFIPELSHPLRRVRQSCLLQVLLELLPCIEPCGCTKRMSFAFMV